jgi:hypothetical protein
MNKATFEVRYNDATTGLFKDNTTKDIGADDARDLVEKVADNVPFTDDDSYTWPFPGVTTTTSTTAFVGTLSPAITGYTNRMKVQVKIHATSTGSATINFNAIGAKKVFINPTTQAGADHLVINQTYLMIYDTALDTGAGGFLVVAGGSGVQSIVAGALLSVNSTDPANPIISHTGVVTEPLGGTNQTSYAQGDTLYASAVDNLAKLTIGANGTVLTSNGTIPQWSDLSNQNPIGVQDLFISASAMWPRITNGCNSLAQTEIATSLFNIQSLDFDQTTQEFAQFQIVLPRKWNNSTVTVVFYWTAASGSGDVQWGISGAAYANDDALTIAFGSPQTVDDTLIAANDLHITSATGALTLSNTPADADFLAFQISRNPGSDTLTADAKLLGVSIRITTNNAKDE